jgi:hypothetical protein
LAELRVRVRPELAAVAVVAVVVAAPESAAA